MSDGEFVESETSRTSRALNVLGVFRNASLAIGPRRGLMVASCLLAVAAAIVETILLFLVARLAIGFANGNRFLVVSLGPIARWQFSTQQIVLIAAGLLVIELVLALPTSELTARLSSATLTRARERVITAHLAAAWSERSQEVEDHLHHLIGNDAQHVERMVQLWSTYTVALAGTVTLSIAAFLIAPIPAVIGGLAFFFIVLLIRPMSKSVKNTAMGFQYSNRGLMTNVAQVARLDKEIAAFEVGDAVRESLLKEVVSSSKMLDRLRFTQRLTPVLYLDASFALVIAGIAVLSAMDVRSVNFLGPLVLLMVRALGYARQLQTSTQSSFEFVPYLVALERDIAAFESAIRPVGPSAIDEIGAIEFINMSFSYIPNHAILTDVNLTIDFGEIVGLVGQSGAGKTTLSEIILRLRQPTSGRLKVTGVDLSEVSPTQWASLIAYVPQDNSLIRATVAENIAFFRSGFDHADIERSAKAAHLHDEIMLMPQGYDTMVGPGERSLSGGQCQRLGIARALLGKPQLLVLDEPTSALDERSESLIKKTLIELKGTATMIVVAHRPTTLAVCTRVLRLADGVLTEISNTGR